MFYLVLIILVVGILGIILVGDDKIFFVVIIDLYE